MGSYPYSASYYGTSDQGGIAWEWIEAVVFDTRRGIRGGCMTHYSEKPKSLARTSSGPATRYASTGFRLPRCVTAKPIADLTGAQIACADRETVESIMQSAASNNYGLKTLMHAVNLRHLFPHP